MHDTLTMETIHAAHNLTIELDPTRWRLYNGAHAPDRPEALQALVEATGSGLACSPAFTRARQLPSTMLTPADVARVVVGWAPESRNWHLGLLLAARPDSGYRMRWCGLASWPSGLAYESSTPARLAGQSLARILNRPFHLVPAVEAIAPPTDTQPLEVTSPMRAAEMPAVLPSIEPRPVPFAFDEWTFEAIPRGYLWQQRSRSVLFLGMRVIGLVLLAVLFVVLGIGTQTTGLASVKPEWLPWLGLAVAVMVAAMAIRDAASLLTLADVIVDVKKTEVRCRSRLIGRVRWRVSFDRIAYVLLSQTPAQGLGRASSRTRGASSSGASSSGASSSGASSSGASSSGADHAESTRIGAECWLHLYDGQRFYEIAQLGRVEGISHNWNSIRRAQRKGRRALRLADYDTPAHHAAVFLARLLDVNVWLDVV